MEITRVEQRDYIKIAVLQGRNAIECRIELAEALGNNALPYRTVGRDKAHFWLNGYVNKQNCRIWREANPQVYVETPLHPEKLTVWCAVWAGGILIQKR
ncbi:hypothetical protein TNCV_1609321 [Trichonephila clavipes]|nr:hypothetical protein TNCV_1609321 [Trichonephila clavipes]